LGIRVKFEFGHFSAPMEKTRGARMGPQALKMMDMFFLKTQY